MHNWVQIIAYSEGFVADMHFNLENNVISLEGLDLFLYFQRFVEDLTFNHVEVCQGYGKMKKKDTPVDFLVVDSCMVRPDFIFDYYNLFLGCSLSRFHFFLDSLDGCFLHAWADFLSMIDYNPNVVMVHFDEDSARDFFVVDLADDYSDRLMNFFVISDLFHSYSIHL